MTQLFNQHNNISDSDYKNHLIEQYKIYVESIEKISDRRMSANNYILSLNTIIISLLSFIFQTNSFENMLLVKFTIPVVGIILSSVSFLLILSYKQLNKGKFKILHIIEKELPLSLYAYEWEILGKGKNYKRYLSFSKIEMIIPLIFGLIYLIFIVYLILI